MNGPQRGDPAEGAAAGALRRNVTFPLLLLYGLGTTVGAGIYALMGPVVESAGPAAPVAFLLASGLAGLTALSFAELSARHPRSAAEATYVREAFGHRAAASVVGLVVAVSGSISAATISRGFAGYLTGLAGVPAALSVAVAVVVLTAIAFWGIRESVLVAGAITLIEIAGLLWVVWSARGALAEVGLRAGELWPGGVDVTWPGVFVGALLAFYAFLGFEDMANVAEEVKRVRLNMPLAIVITLIVTTLLYVLVATATVLTVDREVISRSEDALALVYRVATGRASTPISVIAMVAMLNGALIQIVMVSRVLYGLAGEPGVPRPFGRIHPRTGTPHVATWTVGGAVLVMGVLFPIEDLAATTSSLTLLVFSAVNAALIRIRRRDRETRGAFHVPTWVPWLGLVFNLGFLAYSSWARMAG